MTAAWVIMLHHLERARYDLTLITDQTIPEWVDGAIYGTVVIFWSFTFVQIIFQARNLHPEHTRVLLTRVA